MTTLGVVPALGRILRVLLSGLPAYEDELTGKGHGDFRFATTHIDHFFPLRRTGCIAGH